MADTFGTIGIFIAISAIKMHWITIKMPLAVKGLTLGARKGLIMFPVCVLTEGGWD